MAIKIPPEKNVVLYVARHGDTKLNEDNRFRGPVDAPLSENGRAQAGEIGKGFHSLPLPTTIHASDTRRAGETAKIVKDGQAGGPMPNPRIITSAQLRAWNLGNFGGRKKDAAALADLQGFIDNPNRRIPGGESLNEFRERVKPVLTRLLDAAQRDDKSEHNDKPLIIAHSSVIHELGNMVAGDTTKGLVEPGGLLAVIKAGKGYDLKVLHGKRDAGGGHGIAS